MKDKGRRRLQMQLAKYYMNQSIYKLIFIYRVFSVCFKCFYCKSHTNGALNMYL